MQLQKSALFKSRLAKVMSKNNKLRNPESQRLKNNTKVTRIAIKKTNAQHIRTLIETEPWAIFHNEWKVF